jgi:O-antigen ligase/polysaccharide polymerase Wzy-like membrane protein
MRWVLIGYMFLFIHRPFEVWPVLADLHVERVYMLCALLAVAVHGGKKWIPNAQHFAYLGFALAVAVCWLASRWMDKGENTVENWFKVLVFYLLIVLVVHDEDGLRHLLLGFLGVMAVYMLHSLREYVGGRYVFRMGITRLIGVDQAMGDPNTFGATVVYALPFVVPFWVCNPSRRLRAFLAGYVALSVVCIGLTGSRSSFIGLLLCVAITILRSRWRWGLMVLAVLAAPAMWAALPPSLQNRFETIIYPEVGPANAIESGEGRIVGLEKGLELFASHPAIGVGPGAWRPATGLALESHNLCGQLLGEMGGLGALTFLAILVGFWVNVRAVRRAYRLHPEWERDFLYYVAGAVGLAVFLLLFEGNFGHNLFRYSWLWYGGFLIIARHCVRQREETAIDDWVGEPLAA